MCILRRRLHSQLRESRQLYTGTVFERGSVKSYGAQIKSFMDWFNLQILEIDKSAMEASAAAVGYRDHDNRCHGNRHILEYDDLS